MVSSDRPGPRHPLTPSIAASLAASTGEGALGVGRDGAAGAATQRAAIPVGACNVEIAAAPGLAALAVATSEGQARYAVHAEALGSWAARGAQLLQLQPAREPRECATIRTPFLLDAEGRATIALEAEVAESGVRFSLHVAGSATIPGAELPNRAMAQRPGDPVVRAHSVPESDALSLVEAARGASIVARQGRADAGARGEG